MVEVTSFQVKSGWTRDVERGQDGKVAAITWSGGSVPHFEFEEFGIVLKTPSEPCKLVWRAYQTYADGETTVFAADVPGAERAPVSQVVREGDA